MTPTELLPLLPDLATFVQVVEAGNFSSAARPLGTTPSTISRQVQRLERALGTRLFERSTRRIRLTESGMQVYRHCRDMMDAASGAVDAASQLTAQPRGRVSISAPISLAKSLIHPKIPGFLRTYQEVDVQVVFDDRDIDPIRDHVDLVVRPTPTPPQGLVARRLGTVRWMPCASPGYLRARGTPVVPDDLAQHDCLYIGDTPDDNRWTFRQGSQTQTIEVRARYIANDVSARREAALDDWGVASLPEFAVADDLRAGKLVQVLPEWLFEPRAYSGPVWLLYPPNRLLPPKVRALIDWLVEQSGC
ncbi:LysR family transcriptional regulator [Paraburkholderia dinghuensis]|uniref:LysR family transcriptional regulator n=1 Tax=Paraburkholderia dinghuensis TaxID=2305225 RepID=A0A3N6MS19_9BURK|nr:LysR family transcriptional regulator [Paraburkholderia dinghuensis]RQH06568.1 LysR family transcriptional regulator [Paraburkholderia dinghuensis]